MHSIILQKFVGVREEITLALHKPVGRVYIVRHILPEGVLAEIALVGFLQKILRAAQTRSFHLLGDGNGSRSLRNGHAHRLGFGVGGQGRNDGIIRTGALLQGEIAILQL